MLHRLIRKTRIYYIIYLKEDYS